MTTTSDIKLLEAECARILAADAALVARQEKAAAERRRSYWAKYDPSTARSADTNSQPR